VLLLPGDLGLKLRDSLMRRVFIGLRPLEDELFVHVVLITTRRRAP
jgi:hypothetical protein